MFSIYVPKAFVKGMAFQELAKLTGEELRCFEVDSKTLPKPFTDSKTFPGLGERNNAKCCKGSPCGSSKPKLNLTCVINHRRYLLP